MNGFNRGTSAEIVELSDSDLENVTGGWVGIVVAAAIAVGNFAYQYGRDRAERDNARRKR